MLSFVGNEFLGIEKIICLLVRNCLDLEVVCVNYFYLINNFEIECVFVYLLQRCEKFKEFILNGLFVRNLILFIRSLVYYVCNKEDILIVENKFFFFFGF